MATWTVTSAPSPLNFEFGGSLPRGGNPRIWFRLANAPNGASPGLTAMSPGSTRGDVPPRGVPAGVRTGFAVGRVQL